MRKRKISKKRQSDQAEDLAIQQAINLNSDDEVSNDEDFVVDSDVEDSYDSSLTEEDSSDEESIRQNPKFPNPS